MSNGPPAPEAFRLQDVADLSPILFASTHNGRDYPLAMTRLTRLGQEALRVGEDPHVDALIARAAAQGCSRIEATYARAYVDLNRDPAELDPELFDPPPPAASLRSSARVEAGLGVIPRAFAKGQPIYPARLPLAEAYARIAKAHTPFHAALARLIERARARHGYALLIDVHSMPAQELSAAPQVVVGDLYGRAASASVVGAVEAALAEVGLTTARNAPYAGAYTLERHGAPAVGVHAVQLEFDRGLYLDAAQRGLGPGAERLADKVGVFAAGLIARLRAMGMGREERLAAE